MADDEKKPDKRKDRVGLGGRKRHGIVARLRGYFFAGLLTVAPIGLTLWLFWVLLKFVDGRITPLIPQNYNPNTYLHSIIPFEVPGVGLIVLIIALIIIGALARMLLGRTVVRISENLVNRTPVVRSVYGATKQIVETVLKSQSDAFRQVVLFEYPRRGNWAMGFVTGTTKGEIQALTDDDVVNVFLPTTPNPTSGYLLFVPRRELMPLSMSVEEGIKMIISGGIVTPKDRRPLAEQKIKRIAAADGDKPTITPGDSMAALSEAPKSGVSEPEEDADKGD
ncbi:MAG: DUF502 domain-containing protein [Rhodospirillaceae bacterium]|jgi:uncharacterized membrane protein|nr:DUF502 domain-containing protein [Rhodospirillaceae bacterium]MBT5944664.1 DUF502 domain-containing protein [Rhodospirillaceae bacterium]MBT6402908.1 DUF502 domain-containing protein [Rhodospirillaceae bacterium]MBT6536447.1 DUF502 domain-containing protein [Rhodospirillaceae bacterium]MBT7362902.1 DUF502 domain-containing protein [Rhodospirillaceae bacterium]